MEINVSVPMKLCFFAAPQRSMPLRHRVKCFNRTHAGAAAPRDALEPMGSLWGAPWGVKVPRAGPLELLGPICFTAALSRYQTRKLSRVPCQLWWRALRCQQHEVSTRLAAERGVVCEGMRSELTALLNPVFLAQVEWRKMRIAWTARINASRRDVTCRRWLSLRVSGGRMRA